MYSFIPPSVNFRFDINALRALAVIAVLLFHFDHNLFSGGFVGVDIFFRHLRLFDDRHYS